MERVSRFAPREGNTGTMKRQSWVKSGEVLESGSTVIMGDKRSVCRQTRNDPLNHQPGIDLRFLIGSLLPPYYNS